ncbi:tetratricopeptide repeat protein [Flavivirga aquimarina]|uniref:Tetratricopeptide repeat protein n=1 Tax=Flavivirga aquimarina TaxID=2027862 RepID=A0ABT8W513_9FLAO|nr:tetratricopeptide repeat protein [Flavivirga aquimarina]MDO5968195.1 tetratricopeptide repeat protein [Flavivirga aquimarina]
MKTKTTLFFMFLFIGMNISFAQDDEECKINLSFFHEYVKAKNYDAAYEPWMIVRSKCPKLSIAIYTGGEKILNYKIKKSEGVEKKAFIEDLLVLWKKRGEYFLNKTPKGKYSAKACQLIYKNKSLLGKSDEELYACFDAVYKLDKETFTNPKSLYTYFSLMVDLFDAGKKTDADLFNKYDDIIEKIEDEILNYSEKLNKLFEKKEGGLQLTKKEEQFKGLYENYLENYDLISRNIDKKLGIRANCENLIPLYTKDFDTYQNDAIWLKRAVNRMFYKECTDDALYEKLVKAYDEVSPSSDTKIHVVTVLIKKGKTSEIDKYLREAYDLETNTLKKAKLAYRIGLILKKKGRYSQARKYFRNSLKLNPSNGKPHLAIASMYADSAKNCGDSNFNKRAVYWLAAQEARKASKVDPTLKKSASQYAANYEAKVPTNQEIFIKEMAGKTIKIDCWIKSSVIVPKIGKKTPNN